MPGIPLKHNVVPYGSSETYRQGFQTEHFTIQSHFFASSVVPELHEIRRSSLKTVSGYS